MSNLSTAGISRITTLSKINKREESDSKERNQ
jgi:hypothetical protein